MADPIDFRIVQHLQTALRGIATGSGYHYTVASAAVKLDPNKDVEALLGASKLRPFIVLELGVDSYEYQPAQRVKVTTPVTIHLVNDSDPTDDSAWMLMWSRLCADGEQAITQDITRGGLAVDTRVLSRDFETFGGQQVWAMLKTQVTVLRTYGLPNG